MLSLSVACFFRSGVFFRRRSGVPSSSALMTSAVLGVNLYISAYFEFRLDLLRIAVGDTLRLECSGFITDIATLSSDFVLSTGVSSVAADFFDPALCLGVDGTPFASCLVFNDTPLSNSDVLRLHCSSMEQVSESFINCCCESSCVFCSLLPHGVSACASFSLILLDRRAPSTARLTCCPASNMSFWTNSVAGVVSVSDDRLSTGRDSGLTPPLSF